MQKKVLSVLKEVTYWPKFEERPTPGAQKVGSLVNVYNITSIRRLQAALQVFLGEGNTHLTAEGVSQYSEDKAFLALLYQIQQTFGEKCDMLKILPVFELIAPQVQPSETQDPPNQSGGDNAKPTKRDAPETTSPPPKVEKKEEGRDPKVDMKKPLSDWRRLGLITSRKVPDAQVIMSSPNGDLVFLTKSGELVVWTLDVDKTQFSEAAKVSGYPSTSVPQQIIILDDTTYLILDADNHVYKCDTEAKTFTKYQEGPTDEAIKRVCCVGTHTYFLTHDHTLFRYEQGSQGFQSHKEHTIVDMWPDKGGVGVVLATQAGDLLVQPVATPIHRSTPIGTLKMDGIVNVVPLNGIYLMTTTHNKVLVIPQDQDGEDYAKWVATHQSRTPVVDAIPLQDGFGIMVASAGDGVKVTQARMDAVEILWRDPVSDSSVPPIISVSLQEQGYTHCLFVTRQSEDKSQTTIDVFQTDTAEKEWEAGVFQRLGELRDRATKSWTAGKVVEFGGAVGQAGRWLVSKVTGPDGQPK